MLKNLSDYMSFFTLIFFMFYSFRIFVWAFSDKDINDELLSHFDLLNDYHNNEEE